MSSGPGALRQGSFRIISQVSPEVKKVMGSWGAADCVASVSRTSVSNMLSWGGVQNCDCIVVANSSAFSPASQRRVPLGSWRGLTVGGFLRRALLSLQNLCQPSWESHREPRKFSHWLLWYEVSRSLTSDVWRLKAVLVAGSLCLCHRPLRCLLNVICFWISGGGVCQRRIWC